MLEKIKNGIATIIVTTIIWMLTDIRSLSERNIKLENEIKSLHKFELETKTDIKKLKDSREDLSKYYVTRIEFNRIVTDLKEYNIEMKQDMNKRFDKMEDLILRSNK